MKWLYPFLALTLAPLAFADGAAEVHVYERTLASGIAAQLSDMTFNTLSTYTTRSAPAKNGYIFTHWSISTGQAFVCRDRLGRAKDSVSATIYEATTFTANYLPEAEDSDNDSVADGWEIYWYGDLSKGADSDTDGDGFTFAEELAAGTDPLMADRSLVGGIIWVDGSLMQYNPSGLWPYTIRSEPEGVLFATQSDYVEPGTVVSTSGYAPLSSFAYWIVDGVRAADRHGRAKDSVSVAMPSAPIEIVAVTESDATRRNALYWYGDASVAADSDTDDDGFTFAEELAAGTDPLMPDRSLVGGIVWADGNLEQYNPYNLQPYTIRSEPEGALFATVSDYKEVGTVITAPSYGGDFAYWAVNGVRQADRLGRAKDSFSLTMPEAGVNIVAICESNESIRQSLYWYGSADVSQSSDTDGDGFTFAEELAAGTDPLMPDRSLFGGIVWVDGELLETDLQVYEQVQGAIVGNQFKHFFTSPIAGNKARSETFGEDLQPIVWDLNGDGLFDMVLVYKGGYKTFVNVGYHGNPEFEERKDIAIDGVDVAMNDVSRLAGLTLDVPPPVDALSATTNGTALLVSDSEGRIWYYMGNGEQGTGNGVAGSTNYQLPTINFQLQHKVWGGSRAGFAQGLRLAAVDWDDDGDLDCLAGTADGKLMLLRDPKVGRPTNLKALAGVDNILLTWDPNQQSRIRGYRVYRGTGNGEQETEGDFARIAQPPLPTYRDFPPTTDEYAYKVSSVSRFYTAGNSTPTETESPATEAVVAKTGGVKFFWNDAVAKVGENVEVMLSIENSMNYNVAGKSQTVVYDPEYLTPVKVVKTGLTEGFEVEETYGTKETQGTGTEATGEWQITINGAVGGGTPTLPAGGGKFLVLVFEAQKEGTTKVGGDTGATVSIAAHSAIAPYQLGDLNGDGDVDVEDLRLLAKLKNGTGRKHTANQLKAGDFNGNGKLDNADYQELRKQLKQKGVLK